MARYETRIRKGCAIIGQIVKMASEDFHQVSKIFRSYSQDYAQHVGVDHPDNFLQPAEELQQIDLFAQRLEHTVTLLAMLEKYTSHAGSAPDAGYDQGGFILKLTYFQSALAGKSFAVAAENLKKQLREMHARIACVISAALLPGLYLSNLNRALEYLDFLYSLLRSMAAERQAESPMPDGMTHTLHPLSGCYTMDSERFVLTWLIEHPTGTLDELLTQYELHSTTQHEGEIELF